MQTELLGLAVLYSLLLVLFQRILINVDRMYELRAHMSRHQKHLMELSKNSNASKEEIMEKQKQLLEASSESMRMQIKPMIVTLPLYALLYYLVLPHFFASVPNIQIFSISLDYKWAFIVCSIILTLVLQQLISFYDRRRLKDKYNFGLMQPSFKNEQ